MSALDRAMSIVCRIWGHSIDSYSGRCETCSAQVFTPPKEDR